MWVAPTSRSSASTASPARAASRTCWSGDYNISCCRERLQIEFSRVVQERADATGKELSSAEIWGLFEAEYLALTVPFAYRGHQLAASADAQDRERITLNVERDGRAR